MNNWRWNNPCAFRDQVEGPNHQTTRSGKDIRTGERFSWYSSDDLRVKIELPRCRQYKPGDFLAVRPLNWDKIIDEDDHDENGRIPERQVADIACLAMKMTMTTARVRRTCRAVRKEPGKGTELRMGRRQGRGRGRETERERYCYTVCSQLGHRGRTRAGTF
jgi:hypothetical protein